MKVCAHCRAVRRARELERARRSRARCFARKRGTSAPAWAALQPPRPMYRCDVCTARMKEHVRRRERAEGRRRQARHRKAGLCKWCTKTAVRGVFCTLHADKNAATKRAADAKRKAAGLCVRCTKPIHRNALCKKHWLARSLYMSAYAPDWKAKRAAELAPTG